MARILLLFVLAAGLVACSSGPDAITLASTPVPTPRGTTDPLPLPNPNPHPTTPRPHGTYVGELQISGLPFTQLRINFDATADSAAVAVALGTPGNQFFRQADGTVSFNTTTRQVAVQFQGSLPDCSVGHTFSFYGRLDTATNRITGKVFSPDDPLSNPGTATLTPTDQVTPEMLCTDALVEGTQ